MKVMVTGGAGYIGSHMALVLLRAGHEVVVVDDLSGGHRDAVAAEATFVQADVGDRTRMTELLRVHGVEVVLHFAARIQVGESVRDPRRYYASNVAATLALLDSCLDAGVTRFVQSSTAAVYGDPVRIPIDEEHPTCPVNPYGDTKLAIERMLASYGRAYGLRWAALRYFNSAGADVQAALDERHHDETHLVPLVIDAALGRRPSVTIFGQDYDTPDGTCVRDYIHVLDLCDAHLLAVERLASSTLGPINLGTGRGYSVAQVIDAVRRVSERDIPVLHGPRRPGDPPQLVASAERAAQLLGWRAKRSTLEQIVTDAWKARRAAR